MKIYNCPDSCYVSDVDAGTIFLSSFFKVKICFEKAVMQSIHTLLTIQRGILAFYVKYG